MVVSGLCLQAVPSGIQLRRRRSWELFLGEPDCCPGGAAVLVVNKKSSFTLEDAHTALSIISDEAAARHPAGEAPRLKHMLLTTRADVAPLADAFLRGAPSTPSSKAGRATTMRWEQLESLVRDRGLGRYLATSAGRRSGKGGLPKPPSFTLPDWLLEERKRGASARFDLQSPFEPSGDQPEAIEALARGLEEGKRYQTLLGATGTVSPARSSVSIACLGTDYLILGIRVGYFCTYQNVNYSSNSSVFPCCGSCRDFKYQTRPRLPHACLYPGYWMQGKTFIVANVIQKASLPTLVLAPNKV